MSHAVNDDDARDLAQAIAGDHDAFARIYDRHAAVVLSLCRQRSSLRGDAGGAEDACQETFFRAFRLLPKVNGDVSRAGFRAWLYAIARRVCSEAGRSDRRRRTHEGDAMIAALPRIEARTERVAEAAERFAAQREQLDRLTIALNALPDDERLAIHLYYLERDPVAAAGEAMNLSRSGYYKTLARARQRLTAALGATASI